MYMKQIRLFLVCSMLATAFFYGFAQENETGGDGEDADYTRFRVMSAGVLSANGQAPFWITANRYGVVPLADYSACLQAGLFHRQPLGRGWEWRAGLDVVAAAPRYRKVYVQQLFGELTYRRLGVSLGSRSDPHYSQSLLDPLLSSGDMGISTNARPVPEINLHVSRFTVLPFTGGWLQGKGNFAAGRSFDTDYLTSFVRPDQFFVRDMLWHHKSLYLRVKDTEGTFPVSMTLGVRHLAQWGGVSTDPQAAVRTQPHSFKDFLRIVLGRSGDEQATVSDQINVLGSHYGTYDYHFHYEGEKFAVTAYHQHFFDDASGMELNNGSDGLWGVQAAFPQFPLVRKVVVERLLALNQSGPFHFIDYDHGKYPGYGGGADDYYNNGEYPTGHAYFNRGMGSALFVSPEYNADGTPGFKHTRIRAWHLGAEGNLGAAFSYRLLCSTIESFGRPYRPTLKKLTDTSFLAELSHTLPTAWKFSVSLAADRGSLLGNQSGCSLSVVKWGFIR
jgi:hypothetical protein